MSAPCATYSAPTTYLNIPDSQSITGNTVNLRNGYTAQFQNGITMYSSQVQNPLRLNRRHTA